MGRREASELLSKYHPTTGPVNLQFSGVAGLTCAVQTTPNLPEGWWALGNNTAGADGSWP